MPAALPARSFATPVSRRVRWCASPCGWSSRWQWCYSACRSPPVISWGVRAAVRDFTAARTPHDWTRQPEASVDRQVADRKAVGHIIDHCVIETENAVLHGVNAKGAAL